jgi:hypothetical protein
MLSITFGLKREGIKKILRKLHNELPNLYCSHIILNTGRDGACWLHA